MEKKYSFVCDSANISNHGNLNALGIFGNINARQFPCVCARFVYVAAVEFRLSEIGDHRFRLFFIDEDGREIVPHIEGSIRVTAGSLSANIILELNSVRFAAPGDYQIDLTVDGRHMCSDTIHVLAAGQQKA